MSITYKKGEYDATNLWLLLPALGSILVGGFWVIFDIHTQHRYLPELHKYLTQFGSIVGSRLFVGGFGVIGAVFDSLQYHRISEVLLGLLLIVVPGAMLGLTSFGRRFRRLSPVKKTLAVVGATPGTIMVFSVGISIVIVGLIVGLIVCLFGYMFGAGLGAITEDIQKGIERDKRVGEIEEGVRRAMRR